MQRIDSVPRDGWQQTIESQGLVFPFTGRPDGTQAPYWNEGACYSLTEAEVDTLEKTTADLHQMCLTAVEHIVRMRRYEDFAITNPAVTEAIERSWAAQPPSLYSRFDLSYQGDGSPAKLLEYNADTPTMLVESSICQWYWLQDTHPADDQWNSLHEQLVDQWHALAPALRLGPVHVAYTSADTTGEDMSTAAYLGETAEQAGLNPVLLTMEQIGWHRDRGYFCDLDERPISTLFKLYPWEWVLADEFAPHALSTLRTGDTAWIEPVWKMLLSNKAILAVLWELFPDHPNLLPAYLDGPRGLTSYVGKPLLGREGASIRIVADGEDLTLPGDYGAEGYCYQQFCPLPDYGGNRPVLGTWLVAGEPAGLGIRESDGHVTDQYARFVPHLLPAAPRG